MLRAYTTVIRDSFRAAMNSRVLYIVLALIVLVLLVIAPFHVRQSLDWQLSADRNIPAPDRLVQRLIDEGKSGSRPAVEHVWNLLSDELKADLEKEAESESSENGPGISTAVRKLVVELNGLIEYEDLYDETAFKGRRLDPEAQDLLDKGSARTADEDRRFNRLVLTKALRRDVNSPGQTQLDFYYFRWHWPVFTTSISHASFASYITSLLPTYFDKFIMSIGIFIAILITASIIPEMLEAGSLNLLLSKPVNRWGLLLAKYIGGCVFILLCAILLFVGLWLWMGIQLGIWDRAILLSIPTYVFVFAMYYAVSVLAGIWFRSPILCTVFAVLFWAICSAVGYGYAWLDYRHYNVSAIEIVATGDDVVMVDMLQTTKVWNDIEKDWKNPSSRGVTPEETSFAFATFFDRLDEFPDMPGPVVEAAGTAQENSRVLFMDSGLMDAVSNSQLKLASTAPDIAWKVASRGALPSSTVQILSSAKIGLLAVDQSGSIFQWKGTETDINELESTEDDTEAKKSKNKIGDQIAGFLKRRDQVDYEKLTTNQACSIQAPSAVSLNPTNDEVVFYSEGELFVMQYVDGKYQERLREKIGEHGNKKMTAFVAARGPSIFVMLGNGRFHHLNSDDLSPVKVVDHSQRSAIRSLDAAADGDLAAITFRSGDLWIYDANSNSEFTGSGIGNGDIMACTFDDQDRLWVADRFQGTCCYDLESGEQVIKRTYNGGWMQSGFRYVIRPLYRIIPKPSEFYKLVSHLASSSDAQGNPDIDLTILPHRDDPWSPLRSGIVFTVLVLAISCFIFQRQDF